MSLSAELRDARTGEPVEVAIRSTGGDMDTSGDYPATLVIGRGSATVQELVIRATVPPR